MIISLYCKSYSLYNLLSFVVTHSRRLSFYFIKEVRFVEKKRKKYRSGIQEIYRAILNFSDV